MLANHSFEKASHLGGLKSSVDARVAAKGEYHDNIDDARRAGADSELSRETQPVLFDRIEWLDLLARHVFTGERRPLLLRETEGDATLWLPLVTRGGGRFEAMANWYNFTWSPIFTGNPDADMRRKLLRTAARQLGYRGWHVMVSPVPDEDGLASELASAFRAERWCVDMEKCDDNHVLELAGRSFDEYWQARPGQLRSTVKRKGKKGIVELRIATDFDERDWADYETIYARSWKPEEGNPAMLRELAEREGAKGCARIGIATIDGKAVAAQFWTVENGMALIHKLSHDEDYIKHSPGTLLSHALFRHVIDVDGVDLIDFGTGNDRYKTDWMEANRPRYRLEMVRVRTPRGWPTLAKRSVRRFADRLARGKNSD